MRSSDDDAIIVVAMDPQLQELAATITREVTDAVTVKINQHVTDVVAAAEARLSEQARISLEAVREQATLAADGYAGTLDSINRRLDRIEQKMDSTFAVHEATLKNHNDRITSLEHKRT